MAPRRQRRALFTLIGFITFASGSAYFAYLFLHSPSFSRRKSRLSRFLRLFSDAAHSSAESAALLSSDLQHFLSSDSDHVPRSLRQCFKLTHCSEFQISLALVSAAVARGMFGKPLHSPQTCSDDPHDLDCKDIREVVASTSMPCGEMLSCVELECDWQRRNGDYFPSYVERFSSHALELKRPYEEITNRILDKLFSEPGVAFASSVTSTLATNFVGALFDGFKTPGLANISSMRYKQEASHSSRVIDVICSENFKELISDCIHAFASTAVAVYIDKTKDVNFCNDVVAGISNPAYRDSMKDMLTSICNGAVETFIKTSQNILFAESPRYTVEKDINIHKPMPNTHTPSFLQEIVTNTGFASGTSQINEENTRESFSVPVLQDTGMSFIVEVIPRCRGNNSKLLSVVGGISKTIGIARNHKLVVELGGTMIVEALMSFTNTAFNVISRQAYRNVISEFIRIRTVVQQVRYGEMSRVVGEIIMKAFLLGCICFALWLYVLTASQMERYAQ